jgi:hypothetical protein
MEFVAFAQFQLLDLFFEGAFRHATLSISDSLILKDRSDRKRIACDGTRVVLGARPCDTACDLP